MQLRMFRSTGGTRRILTATLAAALAAGAMAAAPRAAEEPETLCNVAIEMSDGVNLRANITTAGGGPAPTILTVTGYNKDLGNPTGQCSAGEALYVDNGYNRVVVDDRGTGSSGGEWDIWAPRTRKDYVELVDWIVDQPWSDGLIGTTGGSYLGISSLHVAAAAPDHVKAVFADVPMADAYRDVTFFGGNLDTTFMPFWFGFTQGTNTNPPTQAAQGEFGSKLALNTISKARYGPATVGAQLVAGAMTGAEDGEFAAYDTEGQRGRSPAEHGDEIEAAVFWTGGWFDIFQRGEPFLWEALSATPKHGKKWVQGPIYHSGGDSHWDEMGIGTKDEVKLAWFDHWLKGVDNDVEKLPDIHLWQNGREEWETAKDWPIPGTDWTKMKLSAGDPIDPTDGGIWYGTPARASRDNLPFTPVGGLCNRSTFQWAAGAGGGNGLPCDEEQRPSENVVLRYETKPVDEPMHIAGPIVADLWASLDRPDTSFYVALTDVGPDGSSTQITSGGLNASHRAIDEKLSWKNKAGDIILPWHPFTPEARKDAPLFTPTRYQIEVFPTDWVLEEGHSLRLIVGTADVPHYEVPAPALQKMLGGTVKILTGPEYPSQLLLPLQPAR